MRRKWTEYVENDTEQSWDFVFNTFEIMKSKT